MSYRLAELADVVGGTVRGDGDVEIAGIRGLADAETGDITFLTHGRYRRQAAASRASAVVVGSDDPELPQALLICPHPSLAVARLVGLFHPAVPHDPGVHPTAVVADDAQIDAEATIGPYATVGAGSRVGPRAVLHSHVAVGRRCRVAADAVLHPHVVLYDDVEIGERAIVHSGTVLGADGFRYVFHDGVHEKVPQVGGVVIESDVEIGALSAVDRAALEVTRVGSGTKIDNLVQVAHNVQIGRGCILCGGVLMAGSSRLGDFVVMGGSSGVDNHVEVGDGARIAGRASVLRSIPAGAEVAGTPARDANQWRRSTAQLNRIDKLRDRVRALEKRLEESGL